MRLLGLAQAAPRRPEVDQHDLAAEVRELDWLAVVIERGEVRRRQRIFAAAARAQPRWQRWLRAEARARGFRLARRGVRHHPQEEGGHGQPEQSDATADEQHACVEEHARARWLLGLVGHHGQCTGNSAMLKGMSLRGSLSTMPAEDVLDW